ncbi:rubrerythrin [Deferribacter desulfuricans SSM1]|uniref:Rubrerythrin n=1 Tax=Deferribacter desulfuricans (strain DSM 14783 / JCM 11476 / NBRC 101012 / SSM1) TaxID=639282 RepID=D3P8I7_DEFDS|nr:rubrerythrin family protein [Deferribacter desulfuricans]BAI81027.1 rubrerythrin [Deferribacter desulfuricans SSM1]
MTKKSLEGTKTLENLMKSFAGESQARNRYTFYASVARKEGYRQIEALFIETADNEREHGKRFYKHVIENLNLSEPLMVDIKASYPAQLGNTYQNLLAAAAGEHEEFVVLYPEFAEIAEEEGFPEIAHQFRTIAEVEKWHEKRFLKLAENVEKNKVFKRDTKVYWKCRNCGYIFEGFEAPATCPACTHPQEHFELFVENY